MGGRGGYKRLFKGHDIKQVSDQLKDDVPDEIKEKAREMARQELARRLEELNMSEADARAYGLHLEAVEGHIAQLRDLLESMCRVFWVLYRLPLIQYRRSFCQRRGAGLGEAPN